MENCIVSLGVGKNYPRGINRLREHLTKNNVNCDFHGHTAFPPSIPTHQEIPYAFKYFLMRNMFQAGYRRVIWMDASFVPLNDLDFLWQHLEQYGYVVYGANHTLGPYTSDACKDVFRISREALFDLQSCASGIVGFHADSDLGAMILNELIHLAENTAAFANPNPCSIDSRVKGHRPCQSTLALVCNKYGANIWRPLEDEVYTLSKIVPRSIFGKKRDKVERFEPDNPSYLNKNFVLDRVYVKQNWY